MKHILKILTIISLFTLTGCATSVWSSVTEPNYVSEKDGYSASLPTGWIQYAGIRNALAVTKDGTDLQVIKIIRDDHKNAFEALEKSSSADMLPQEVAENMVAEIKAIYELDNISTISNDPAMLSGQPGYRLLLEYKTPRGLRRKYLAYGFTNEKGLYNLIYEAPTLHYFDKDVAAFENVVKSFTLN